MTAKLDNARALYMEGIRDGHARQAVEKYTGDRYTQHSTGVRDGVEGFVEFFEGFLERNPIRDIQIVRGWEDGQYVFVQAFQRINNGEAEWITTDFFDTDANDKIIEHWDIIAAFQGPNPSGHTAVDGATELCDLDQTEQNKTRVRELVEQVYFANGDVTCIDDLIDETYIEHSVGSSDGRAALRDWATNPSRNEWYSEIVLLVGHGNFVATLCKVDIAGKPFAKCDIFRIANGKVVEHWDNAEPVPPKEEWVNSGKF